MFQFSFGKVTELTKNGEYVRYDGKKREDRTESVIISAESGSIKPNPGGFL